MYRSVTNTLSIPHLEISQKSSNKRSPEAKYQDYKQQWYFHPSSWYRRKNGEGSYDGKGCNQFTGCIPECKFYSQNGRLEEDEGFD
jgi:hypothetical protein